MTGGQSEGEESGQTHRTVAVRSHCYLKHKKSMTGLRLSICKIKHSKVFCSQMKFSSLISHWAIIPAPLDSASPWKSTIQATVMATAMLHLLKQIHLGVGVRACRETEAFWFTSGKKEESNFPNKSLIRLTIRKRKKIMAWYCKAGAWSC